MAYPAKVNRNERIVALRKLNPKKYTFALLGRQFKIAPKQAYKIYYRESARV